MSKYEVKDSGTRRAFATGAVRDMAVGKGRMDLLPAFAVLELAKHLEAGAIKYGDENWRKGIPLRVYLDSALRHGFKFLLGMRDERHDLAMLWNIACLIETAEMIGRGLLPDHLDNLPDYYNPPTRIAVTGPEPVPEAVQVQRDAIAELQPDAMGTLYTASFDADNNLTSIDPDTEALNEWLEAREKRAAGIPDGTYYVANPSCGIYEIQVSDKGVVDNNGGLWGGSVAENKIARGEWVKDRPYKLMPLDLDVPAAEVFDAFDGSLRTHADETAERWGDMMRNPHRYTHRELADFHPFTDPAKAGEGLTGEYPVEIVTDEDDSLPTESFPLECIAVMEVEAGEAIGQADLFNPLLIINGEDAREYDGPEACEATGGCKLPPAHDEEDMEPFVMCRLPDVTDSRRWCVFGGKTWFSTTLNPDPIVSTIMLPWVVAERIKSGLFVVEAVGHKRKDGR